MSAVFVLSPIVMAMWPTFSAAVVAAAGSLGYVVVDETARQFSAPTEQKGTRRVNLEIAHSEIVTDQLGHDRRITVARDGVTVMFSRDARGKARLCVSGKGHTDAELRALGEKLSQRVVQRYVYQRLLDEARARGFVVVEDEVEENEAIRLKIRHWEN